MRSITEQEVEASLTVHAPLYQFVLIGEDDESLSVFSAGRDGLAILHIEQEELQQAAVALLKKRRTRQYKSIPEYAAATGWDGIARVSPIE